MDNNLTEKFNKFTALVLKDSEKKRDKLLSDIEAEEKKRLEEMETKYLSEAYDKIQSVKSAEGKLANERVLHAEMDAKKMLINKREEIISNVFKEVKKRLEDFAKSAEYESWLINKTKKALDEVGKGQKTVYISDNDDKYKRALCALDSDITVEETIDRNFESGVRVYNIDRKVAVDYSFHEMLAESEKEFLQTSGLSIQNI